MTIQEKIQSWCDSSIIGLVEEYDKQNRRASGNWEKELESRIEVTGTGYNVKILGAYYTWWMEHGRRPSNKFPPIKAIKKWIEDKGIIAKDISQDSLAFLIARKIAREGYKGRPVVASVITDQWVNDLVMNVGMFFVEDIKSEILTTLKAA